MTRIPPRPRLIFRAYDFMFLECPELPKVPNEGIGPKPYFESIYDLDFWKLFGIQVSALQGFGKWEPILGVTSSTP